MKKILILALVLAVSLSERAYAQCGTSKAFEKSLQNYKKIVAGDNSHMRDVSGRDSRLGIELNILSLADSCLSAIKTEEDYVVFLYEVRVEDYLPSDAKTEFFAMADTSYNQYLQLNYSNLKRLNDGYMAHLAKISQNQFSKNSLEFVNKNIVDVKIIMDKMFQAWTVPVLAKNIQQYSPYELFVIDWFSDFDTYTETIEKADMLNAVKKLEATGCPAYIDLADSFRREFED